MYFDTTVLNGLSVTVHYEVLPAEPDVGIINDYAEITHILVKKETKEPKWEIATWVTNRLSDEDWAILEEKAMESYYGE